MFKSKYSNFLTILLIVAIIVIIAIVSIVVVSIYKKHKNTLEASRAISDFDNNVGSTTEDRQDFVEQEVAQSQSNSNSKNNGTRKVTYYNNYVMSGYIEIPTIKIKYPVLEDETVSSLEQSVAIRYPSHATLNSVGNVVIVGHNYRNGMFFSNLKKVSTGDKIKITDADGQTKVYTVYEVYETTPEDTSYITRDVGDNIEITLVTCTDDSKQRIIVKARV